MYQIKKIIFCLLFVISICAYNQSVQQKKDSLIFLLKGEVNDSLFVTYHMHLGILMDTSDHIEAEAYLKKALFKLNSDYTFSDKFKMIAWAYDCLGIIERRRNNYDKALEFYLKALKVKEKSKDSSKIGRSYHNIAMLFAAKRDYDKAISYMKLALPLRKKNRASYGSSLRNYASFYYKIKEYDTALSILDSAAFFLKENPISFADVRIVYARIYRKKKQYKKALLIHKKNLKTYTQFEKLERKAIAYKNIATLYRKLKEYKNAFLYLDSTENIAKNYNNKTIIYQSYLDRYRIYKAQKNYKKALENYRVYKKYHDSVFRNRQSEKIAILELEFKRDKKKAVEKLNYEANEKYLKAIAVSQRSQKKLYAILFFIACLAFLTLFFLFRYKQKINKELTKKQDLETKLLNEQTIFLQYKINQLLANDKMQSDFKERFIQQIKSLKKQENSESLLKQYNSMLIEIENQLKTETRLNTTNKNTKESKVLDFELKLAKKFINLTKSEREICHLIYLNLSLKEIMNVRGVTLPSIKSARYRIRKKLEVPKGVELELFIQELF